ncbi:GroES-like zinc-binding alcohol dehydrogenase family protein [Hibiscus syriacus]|uniref:GroES-like zinc-binding alcohol dehydrogenase family protein n=1 Tax=Hibiscus syriacus TaxID=106335 RepID=A0A6A3AYD7_HIBSY|nr:GroES-like zinc-binding alcohol dehydrogenase family protein [Hibiscus syriacus]
MKIPSKSIISPGRSREPSSSSQISLSSSLSWRLRSNGSMKGGQASPMFPKTSNGKKRGGGGFENPEPSSPKVTCIGQVRVKTKKQGKKLRACRSKRREVSFRKVGHGNGSSNSLDHQDYNMGHFLSSSSHHQQQQQQECKKWVHYPLTICEALRAFGSEFNCFLPCRSSCLANQRDNNKEEKSRGYGNGNGNGNGRSSSSSSCGAVFTRWLVAVQDWEGEGKEREIELVVGEEEDDDERRESSGMMISSSRRRHVFEDIEINDFVTDNIGDDEDEARASICVPPKNALLLKRCRSDPVKMAGLANKFWETPLPKDEHEEDEAAEEAGNGSEEKLEEQEGPLVQEDTVEAEMGHEEVNEVGEMLVSCEADDEEEIPEAGTEVESVLVKDESSEVVEETSVECQDQEHENPPFEENESAIEDLLQQEDEDEVEEGEDQTEAEEEEEEEEDSTVVGEGETTHERSEFGKPENDSKESESEEKLLPDCLLLMMCEPKLSMEVSKETWVCSTDFIRWLPEKRKQPVVKQKDGGDEPKRRISVDSNPRPIFIQPPRSSCSFPVAPPMDTAVAAASNGAGGGGSMSTTKDHKVVGGKGYEPFALTRCKSEPRKPSDKLAPDACFWKNRKLEPTSVGVGAAGVGF